MNLDLDYEAITVDRRPDGVDRVVLNRPERMNAITTQMTIELADYFADLVDRPAVRVVLLRGAGTAFCAGLDIKARVLGEDDGKRSPRLPEMILSMRACPQPIIALVHGPASGGGFAIALAADIRIAGHSARMNDAFVKLGISGCELGLSYFLPRQVGLSVAAELMYTGRFVDAARALAIGLVSEVVPDDELDGAGERLAAEMLTVAPLALRKTKETLRRCIDVPDLAEVLDLEMVTQRECAASPNFREALEAFVQKRPPQFSE